MTRRNTGHSGGPTRQQAINKLMVDNAPVLRAISPGDGIEFPNVRTVLARGLLAYHKIYVSHEKAGEILALHGLFKKTGKESLDLKKLREAR